LTSLGKTTFSTTCCYLPESRTQRSIQAQNYFHEDTA